MKFKKITPEEKELDARLVQIIQTYDLTSLVTAITMTNLSVEKKKFFRSLEKKKVYNPQFTYKPLPDTFDAKKILSELEELKQDRQSSISILLEKKRVELVNMVHLFCSVGTEDFTKHSISVFSKPSKELIKHAKSELDSKLVKMKSEPSKRNRPIGYFVSQCEKMMEELDLDWKICVKNKNDMLNRVKVKTNSRELWINEDKAPFTQTDVKKLLQHEVYVHIQRYENGRRSPLQILRYGTANYIATEEGLAGFYELQVDSLSPWFHKTKMLLAIAEDKALTSSFYEVFSYLISLGASKQKAFSITTRIKRGLSDTSKPGAFTKDHVYLEGEEMIERYYLNGGDISKLFAGKFGIEDLDLLFEKE